LQKTSPEPKILAEDLPRKFHRKWPQEGFPGNGARKASQEVAVWRDPRESPDHGSFHLLSDPKNFNEEKKSSKGHWLARKISSGPPSQKEMAGFGAWPNLRETLEKVKTTEVSQEGSQKVSQPKPSQDASPENQPAKTLPGGLPRKSASQNTRRRPPQKLRTQSPRKRPPQHT
jgi:hypothetical protein